MRIYVLFSGVCEGVYGYVFYFLVYVRGCVRICVLFSGVCEGVCGYMLYFLMYVRVCSSVQICFTIFWCI